MQTATTGRMSAAVKNGVQALESRMPGKRARPVCAVRRAVVNLLQTGRTRRTVLGSPNLPESERCRGQQHVRKAVVIRDANG
jgi:hypothetical protein